MNTSLETERKKRSRGRDVRLKLGIAGMTRPIRSPAFQKRKPRGMKEEGWKRRGAVAGFRTLRICWVKTGYIIVRAKVRNTAPASQKSFLRRRVRGMDLRLIEEG